MHHGRVVGWAVVVVAGIGCGPETPPDPGPDVDPLALLSEPGPFAVGYREESVSWTETGLQDEPRTNRLAVWFPTDAESGSEVRYQGAFPAPGVLGDVEPAPGSHPLVVFSHGHQGFAENSSFLMTHLASHGWWVLAPDHTGNTTFDDGSRETAIYWQRPLDLRAVVDHAEETLDLEGELVVVGHSFGGYTVHGSAGAEYAIDTLAPACADGTDTSEFCSTMTDAQADRFRAGLGDDRIAATVAMAPGDWRLFGDGLAAIDVPELLMTGGLDPGRDGDPIWDDLDGDQDLRIDIPTAGHNGFTDFSGALDPVGAIDPEEGFRIVRTYVLAFVRRHGLGDEVGAPLLDGTTEVSPLAQIIRP